MSVHIPVLLNEVIEYLDLKPDNIVVDGTVNGGGHASEIAALLDERGVFIGIDQDSKGLAVSRERLADAQPQIHLIHRNTRELNDILAGLQISHIDRLLLDLGWSSNQFEDPERGFSFLHDGPLSMLLGDVPDTTLFTAYDVVNEWEESSLYDIIRGYGEERFAKRIAETIVRKREEKPIERTLELAEIIKEAIPKRFQTKGIHPATKTFQALRIAVNDEMEALKEILEKGWNKLSPDGRLLVISFHSIEDRIVKNFYRQKVSEGQAIKITKKPITASPSELSDNRRSRSAKLRILQKI